MTSDASRATRVGVFRLGPKIDLLPIIHGSGDFSILVRERLLEHPYDCLAVPLPESFQEAVEAAILDLPTISAVVQRDAAMPDPDDDEAVAYLNQLTAVPSQDPTAPSQEEDPTLSDGLDLDVGIDPLEDSDELRGFSYVPIDPCQGVIMGLRTALEERIARIFIDLETPRFDATHAIYPDPYALKKARPEAFASAMLPFLPIPNSIQIAQRILYMAQRLRALESDHESILCLCSMLDWPWIRDAYHRRIKVPEPNFDPSEVQTATVDPRTLIFILGELPFITGLYERGRHELTEDRNLSVDGVKELLLATRQRIRRRFPRLAPQLTPQLLTVYIRYVRNLCLIERRLTPDLYTLVVAAQQIGGDEFALALAETVRQYPYMRLDRFADAPEWADDPDESEALNELDDALSPEEPEDPDDALDSDPLEFDPLDEAEAEDLDTSRLIRMGDGQAEIPGWGLTTIVSRLPGQAISWRTLELKPRPPRRRQDRWRQRWNPFGICSWPPEDNRIESFQRHVRDQAKALLGADLARSEKFTTSVMDGLDIRETLRNWHSGDIYVKRIPPSRGSLDVVCFLFDVPADPERYNHRTTWYAEHPNESTLAFFSTDPLQNLIGPGIAQAEYGGAFFLFPPRPIPDIWLDPRTRLGRSLEERLLAGACLHTREKHVAVVSPGPPRLSWRQIARRLGKRIIHLPLSRFSNQTIERLRLFHILNGKHVRSYAASFIRDL